MANNRLYIGNKDTKEYECITKSSDDWRELSEKDFVLFNRILKTDNSWSKKTNLVLFTESDDKLYEYFVG